MKIHEHKRHQYKNKCLPYQSRELHVDTPLRLLSTRWVSTLVIIYCAALLSLRPHCHQLVPNLCLETCRGNRKIIGKYLHGWSFSVILIWKLLATQTAHAHYLCTLLYVMVMERPISQRVMQDANSSLTGYMYKLVWTRKKANPYISIIFSHYIKRWKYNVCSKYYNTARS